VRLMQARNDAWIAKFGLANGAHYHWVLDEGVLVFPSQGHSLMADITVVGTVSAAEGTFLWAWANEAMPAQSRRDIGKVRDFGVTNALGLLLTPEWPGGYPDGLEMAAVAGRILEGEGVWVDTSGDVTTYFVLSRIRLQSDPPG